MANPLATYRAKRDFARTPEPAGGKTPHTARHSFVIQKHAARRLHYDFRLEHDGVMWSWSVPKGPSLSPKERRLAVRTEDHPLEYRNFEGVIPQGQYGGGAVAIWDRGSWSCDGDPAAAMAKGRLTFTLTGEKLRGRWHLVRTKPQGKQETWLLFKGRDEEADDTRDIVEDAPASVISGRDVDEIAATPDAPVWHSNHPTAVSALVSQLPVGFQLTNLDKVLYPAQGITKGQLVAYFAVMAEHMLPHVAERLLTLVRCPDGQGKPCFFQKHPLPGSPRAIERLPDDHMAIHDLAGLVACAQLGALEIHTWGARADQPEQPDVMVFDLDPDPELPWERVALAAFAMRRQLNELGLTSFVKTTGGKGLHVTVPIVRGPSWTEVKAFTKAVVEKMERAEPGAYTTNMAKRHRKNKIFLDYLRNGRGATFVAPYSPRARDHATVAVPITWEELAHGVEPASFTTVTVPKRVAGLDEDPWAGYASAARAISARAWKLVGGKPT